MLMESTISTKVLTAVIGLLWGGLTAVGGFAFGAAQDHEHTSVVRLQAQMVETNRRLGAIESKLDRLMSSDPPIRFSPSVLQDQ